jgi:hypothetical protein
MKYTTLCGGINGDCASLNKYNYIYLLIKYLKKRSLESSGTPACLSVCLSVCLSYT